MGGERSKIETLLLSASLTDEVITAFTSVAIASFWAMRQQQRITWSLCLMKSCINALSLHHLVGSGLASLKWGYQPQSKAHGQQPVSCRQLLVPQQMWHVRANLQSCSEGKAWDPGLMHESMLPRAKYTDWGSTRHCWANLPVES